MLKKMLLFVCLLFFLIPSVSIFAFEAPHKNAVSMDPIQIILNYWSFSYERAITDKISVKGTVAYSPNFFWVTDISYLDLAVEGRYYWGGHLRNLVDELPVPEEIINKVFGNALSGLYAGAFVEGVTATIEDWTEDSVTFDATFLAMGGGLTVGCKYAFWGESFSFYAEPYGGLRFFVPVGGLNGWTYKDSSSGDEINSKPGDFDDGFGRSVFYGGISVGVSF